MGHQCLNEKCVWTYAFIKIPSYVIRTWCFAGRFVYGIFDHIRRNVPKAECYNTPVIGHDAEPLGFNFHPHGPFREDPA
jgi:hypothetical protein